MKRRPEKKSAIILPCRTIIATAPTPANVRPAAMPDGPSPDALTTEPTVISNNPPPSTHRSPNRRPSAPNGRATKTPASMNAPISRPNAAYDR